MLSLASLSGCGRSEPFTYVPVSGKVTYDDGSLIQADHILLTFLPQANAVRPGVHPRAGNAEVRVEDGTFASATSHKPGDGLTAGEHIVLVQAFDQDMLATDAIPERYADPRTTSLRANTAGKPFHFKIAKKTRGIGGKDKQ